MNTSKKSLAYSAHLTAGGLLYHETIRCLPLLLQEDYSEKLKKEAEKNKYILTKSQASRKRMTQELRLRAEHAPGWFWQEFQSRTEPEQRMLLFYLCLRTYKLLFDMHFDVVVERWNRLFHTVEKHDVLFRIDQMAVDDEVIASWTESTISKVATVYIRMLRESGMLKNKKLHPLDSDFTCWAMIAKENDLWMMDAALLSAQEKSRILD